MNDVHLCRCDACQREKKNFTEYRYKCLVCFDYDLCGKCFERRKISKTHFISHPMVRFDLPDEIFGVKMENENINLENLNEMFKYELHEGVKCNFCSKESIQGLRFKCDICNEFNICYECFRKEKSTVNHSSKDHPLIVYGKMYSLQLEATSIEKERVPLGKGGFGTVYKAKLKEYNDKIVACKVISLNVANDLNEHSEDQMTNLHKSYVQELKAYKEIKGENILRMFGHCLDIDIVRGSINLLIITELMSKGSLYDLIRVNETDLSNRRKFDIACDIASGMARIHDHFPIIIHKDIRPDNILIDANYTAKIGDMGIAKLKERYNILGPGYQPYMPPEYYNGLYDEKLDVFTFGLTLNFMFNGKHNEKDMFRHYEILRQADIFDEYVKSCANADQIKRPSSKIISNKFDQLKKLFNEEIFTKNMFHIYATWTTSQKNSHFKMLYEKFMRNDGELYI